MPAGTEQNYLMISDVHYDSLHCDRKLLKKILDQALEKNAKIMIFGDLFDAMGGKYDPRTAKEEIRPEYTRGGYFGQIVDDMISFLTPYKENIIFISDGNHELSVLKRQEFNLIDFTIAGLDKRIVHGKYQGFIRFYFSRSDKTQTSKLMWYTHGSGGNAPVTKGSIKTNRRQDQILADFFVSGHIHTAFEFPRTQRRLNKDNIIENIEVEHWQLGTFKLEQSDWEMQKEFSEGNPGGRWLKFYHDISMPGRVNWESKRAK
jgi:predicted phosphodiesterase